MTDLYRRVLLWHKLLAQQTGGLALCSAKHRLNRDEARGWATMLRNVSDEINEFLDTGAFILDERGQRVVQSVHRAVLAAETQPRSDGTSTETATGGKGVGAVSRKASGLRIATRKK